MTTTPRAQLLDAFKAQRLADRPAASPATPTGPTLPTVNLNGTHRNDLVRQHSDVLAATETLRVALRAAFPHGRDYQLAPATYQAAYLEAEAELLEIERLIDRHTAITRHLLED